MVAYYVYYEKWGGAGESGDRVLYEEVLHSNSALEADREEYEALRTEYPGCVGPYNAIKGTVVNFKTVSTITKVVIAE